MAGTDLRLMVPPGSYLAQMGINLTATGSQGQTFTTAQPQFNPFKANSSPVNNPDLGNSTFLDVYI